MDGVKKNQHAEKVRKNFLPLNEVIASEGRYLEQEMRSSAPFLFP